ncbi:hypothetical protein E1218_14255 [Kribbella turkmenica]|uniref:Uncharacterized protein n=1 Tax=Kribbella turkmenica TaxID=2530375 RepID=A0A4R4X622_9ACTN|nr:hypothetical protein [Kribbella turkmenica]TDD25828.1 hypothetical protein E1218_14255 [Kribbella turkmenica]
MFSVKDYRLLSEAHGILVHRCMQRYGANYPVRPFQDGGAETRNQGRYGITDPAEAGHFGYRMPGRDKKPAPSARPYDPRIDALLTGTGAPSVAGRPLPKDGCAGEAQRFLAGGTAGPEDIAEPMGMKSWDQSRADPRVQEVFVRWSDCMKKNGLNHRTPLGSSRDRELVKKLTLSRSRRQSPMPPVSGNPT